MEVKKKLKKLESILFWVKIGYHSRFNPECNTERGFIHSMYIALGLRASSMHFVYRMCATITRS